MECGRIRRTSLDNLAQNPSCSSISVLEVNSIIDELWKENKKARHIVYAYRVGSLEKNFADKEPGGTTRGLLDLIHMKNRDNTLVVVIRYFGGILLGSGPLTRTYTKVASMLFVE